MEMYGSGWKRGETHCVSITLLGTDAQFIDLIDNLELAVNAAGLPPRSKDALSEIMRQVNYWSGTLVDHPAPNGRITFPEPICPDRAAGKIHPKHRIEGTWRTECPGISALQKAQLLVMEHLAEADVDYASLIAALAKELDVQKD